MRLNLLVLALAAAIVPAAANAATSIENWPTKYTFGDGTELGLTGNYAYDDNNFSGDDRLEDRNDFRRKEFGATIKKKGVYDAMVYYDFESKLWLDVFYRFETKALFGQDYGRVRLGYMKVPVGLEAVQSSRAGSFMELGLPIQAVFQGRRTGAEWTLERQQYLLQAGAYGGKDLQGDNPGTTQAVHAAWTPMKAEGDVLHLGIAGSIENPRGYSDGRGVSFSPRVRLRARPEAGLTDVRLIDTGTILDVDHVIRTGLEAVWIHGPFSLQSEALACRSGAQREPAALHRPGPVRLRHLDADRRIAQLCRRRAGQHQAVARLRRGRADRPLQPPEPGRQQCAWRPSARHHHRRQLVPHQPLQVPGQLQLGGFLAQWRA